jgi:condensin complex subunit 1
MVNEDPTNRLAIELIREIGRLNPGGGTADSKASGVRNLAPFVSELAQMRPRIVLASISHIAPLLECEAYAIRSSIVTAMGHILVHISGEDSANGATNTSNVDLSKSRNALLDILSDRVHDVSSFTRGAVMKAWISIVQTGSLPINRLMPVTAIAADRLQDKTVMVRRSAMQVRY